MKPLMTTDDVQPGPELPQEYGKVLAGHPVEMLAKAERASEAAADAAEAYVEACRKMKVRPYHPFNMPGHQTGD